MQRTLPGQTVGIDLGSLNSAIAQLNDDGQLLILPNSEQQNFTPSVVLLPDGKFVVGPTFERISQEPPENVVESIKRLMGNREWFKLYQGKKLTPEFISALILKRLKQDAEKHIGPVT
ncbi:MAG: dnaK 4, partial [Planctomycetaceae bacterium]|nr:dnaK 4 [Planctomycetaceae bacterium]